MNFLLNTKCSANCKFCFVPKKVRNGNDEMSFAAFRQYIRHAEKLFGSNKPVIGILGGEPTLAKDFPMIAGYAKTYTGGIRLYSNLITSSEKIKYILGAKNTVLVWNAGSYISADSDTKKLILKNLKTVKDDFKNNVIASITVSEDFTRDKFFKIINLLLKFKIKNVRIAVDSTNYKPFVNYGTEIYSFVKYLKKLDFNIFSSYCGHFIKGMFTSSQEKYLKENIMNFNYNDCSVNYPLDVLPDGSVVPCVSFAGRNRKINFLDFKNLKQLKNKTEKEFNLKNPVSEICAANYEPQNKIKIITGFNPETNDIKYLKTNNVDEVYCGYYDKETEKKWPVAFGCINRRGEGVNFKSWNELVSFSKAAAKENIKVYVTLNSHYYVKEQYPWLIKTVERISKEKSVSGIIANDIGLLLTLKKLKFKKKITVSTLATAFNSNAVDFYKRFGADRIVLDRQMTSEEITDIVRRHKDTEFEVFVLSSGGCLFTDGYCSLFHCFEKEKNVTALTAEKYDITTPGAGCCSVIDSFSKNQFENTNIRKQKFDIDKTFGFACNICMLYSLKNEKNISFKIDSRGSNGSGVTTVEMLNELNKAAADSQSEKEYIKKAKQILYKYKKVKCNHELCLYRKNK